MLYAAFAMMYYLIALDAHTFGDLPEQAGPQLALERRRR
jgi:hypothetical protein